MSEAKLSVSGLRVLVTHDWLVTWAGSERCLDQILTLFPDADLIVGVMAESMREHNGVTRRAKETWLARLPGARSHHRWYLPLEALAFASVDTRGYDLVFSSCHAFSKMIARSRRPLQLCYCYSPPRYLWDLNSTYKSAASSAEYLALAAGGPFLRALDRWSAGRIDHFIAISECVAQRIRRWYGRAADVVYPPVAPKSVIGPRGPREDFLLYLGRLVPYKRVDLAMLAAERLGLRLIVAGDGPDLSRLLKVGSRMTKFVGEVSEREAGELLSKAAAFVFCGEEDFGIAPVEANAHGAPVVALRAGGIVETMREGETAVLFDSPTVEAVCDAIKKALNRPWDEHALRSNANRFSPEMFRRGLTESVNRALTGSTGRSKLPNGSYGQ